MKTASHPGSVIEPLENRIAPAFAAALDLSGLLVSDGFQINGEASYDKAGTSVSGAGDVNGDGFDDLIIGASGVDSNDPDTGASYVVFGKAAGFGTALTLSSLDGFNGFRINGEANGDRSSRSVSAAGDVNGDGFDDLIVGAHASDPNGSFSGAAYVIFGKATGFAATLELSTLNGSNGFQINGEAEDDYAGYSVSGAGDMNGDGFDDLIIGAYNANANGSFSGAAYVVFGKNTEFSATFELSSLTGTNGFQISGEMASDFAGISVSGAGDVNGDGFDDVLIGASGADPNGSESGTTYVVFGKATGFSATLNLSTLDGTNGFQINGEADGDRSGRSVSAAGDINGDGFDDLIIGAYQSDANGFHSGAAYVVFGKAAGFGATLELSSLNGTNGFQVNGEAASDKLGYSVSGAGDLNGDGFDDLILGATGADPNGSESGATYVLFGKATAFSAVLSLSTLDGANGFQINGEGVAHRSGSSVSGIGDLNGDGFHDLILGAPDANFNGGGSGASYVILGRSSAPDASVTLVNATTATFTDVDGDLVTIKTTKGTLDASDFTLVAEGLGARLVSINLADDGAIFAKTNLTITAKRAGGGGDGLTTVGFINAAGGDLGEVIVDGDLGHLIAGDNDTRGTAVKSLIVRSIGLHTSLTGAPESGSASLITGALGHVIVKSNIYGGSFRVSGGADGDIRSMTINGSLFGGEGDHSGSIKASGSIQNLVISGNVTNATISALGTIGPADNTAAIALGKVAIGGTVQHSNILAGYDLAGAAANADVHTGKIKVAGDWIASNLAVGVSAGTDGFFGTADDTLIAGGNSITARIAKLTVLGHAWGSIATGDTFGFVAQEIAALKIGKAAITVAPGGGNDGPLTFGLTRDVVVLEK